MYAVNDIAHQRFDFVNFHRKPFHPIGKLDRLSFKFEKANGRSYDFKGANHLLIINIKYLVPTQKRRFERSILNPNYRYDANPSLLRHIEYKEHSASDDDEEDNDAYLLQLTKNEAQYDYSSSEDNFDVRDIRNVRESSSDESEVEYTTTIGTQ
jgi:hypothetical protein